MFKSSTYLLMFIFIEDMFRKLTKIELNKILKKHGEFPVIDKI